MIKFPEVGPHWARLKAVMERKQRQQAPKVPERGIPAWLVQAAHISSWVSAAIAAFFMWEFCIGIAGDQSNALHVTHAGTWIGEIKFFFPLVIGFMMISFGIPFLAKNIIAIFVSFSWREHFWPKFWTLVLVISASVEIIAGSFSVMGGAIIENGRGAAVAVETVGQGRAVLQSRIDAVTADLNTMMNNRNAYLAQACSVGAKEWQASYIAKTAPSDPQFDRITRALGAAKNCDDTRAQRDKLRDQLATAPTIASVVATPETSGTAWIVQAMAFVRGAWALMLSVLNDVVCLLMGWLALRLEQARAGQVATYGGTIAIEDHSEEAPLQVRPYAEAVAQKEEAEITDPITGEKHKIVRRREHWARVPTSRANRRTQNKPGGKVEKDSTEYEKAATHSVVNADYADPVQMETVKVEEPRDEEFIEPSDGVSDRGAVGPDSGVADDRDSIRDPEPQPASYVAEHSDDGGVSAAADGLHPDADEPSEAVAPPPIPDEIVDEMIARGLAEEDADGFITPVTPEIVQVDDDAPRYPQLPKPNGKLEHMQ